MIHGVDGAFEPVLKGALPHIQKLAYSGYHCFFVENAPIPQKLNKGVCLFYFFILRAIYVPPDPMRALGVVIQVGSGYVSGRGFSHFIASFGAG